MHLHWKYRELVKILVKAKTFDQVKKVALALEAESGGVLVSVDKVSKGYAIVVFRGKDYKRPAMLRPKNLLTKRKALARSIELQRSEVYLQICMLLILVFGHTGRGLICISRVAYQLAFSLDSRARQAELLCKNSSEGTLSVVLLVWQPSRHIVEIYHIEYIHIEACTDVPHIQHTFYPIKNALYILKALYLYMQRSPLIFS